MATNISKDLTEQLKAQIESFKPTLAVDSIGHVLEVGDGIARVSGLAGVRSQELVQFANGTLGLAFNLEETEVGVTILGEYGDLQEGSQVKALGRVASVPVGDDMVGRVVDARVVHVGFAAVDHLAALHVVAAVDAAAEGMTAALTLAVELALLPGGRAAEIGAGPVLDDRLGIFSGRSLRNFVDGIGSVSGLEGDHGNGRSDEGGDECTHDILLY